MSSTPPAMPPPPNFGQIPLPPGMTLEQFESLQGSLVTLAIVTAVAFGALVWDYLLPDEIKMYQTSNKKVWRTSATWAFVVLRYSGILASLPSLFFTSVQSNHCQTAVTISQIGVVLVVASSGIIFSCRVFAIWGENNVIRAIVGVAYVVMIACWISVSPHYRAVNGPPTPFGSNCQVQPIPSWSPISFASSVAFDAVILILTVAKLNTNRATSSKVGYLIYRDSLMYFCLTAATNITLLIIDTRGESQNLLKADATPFSTLITATMGARVFLNLKLFYHRQDRAQHELPSGSSTSSRSTGKPPRPVTPSPNARSVQNYPMVIISEGASKQSDLAFSTYSSPKRPTSFEGDDRLQEQEQGRVRH